MSQTTSLYDRVNGIFPGVIKTGAWDALGERDIWWLHGARGPHEHPFAAEARALRTSLPRAREHVFYSAASQIVQICVVGTGSEFTLVAPTAS